MSITLLTTKDQKNIRTQELVIASKLAECHVGIEVADEKNKEDFNLGNKLPALRTPEGGLWEVNAILRFFGRVSQKYPLYGRSSYEAGLIDTWIDWSRNEIESYATVIFPISKIQDISPEAVADVIDHLKVSFDVLNKHLLTNMFLASNRINIADLAVTFALIPLLSEIIDAGFRKQYPNMIRWYETVINQPQFLEVVGEVKYCSKNPLPALPKKQPPSKKKGDKKKEGEGGDEGPDEPDLEEAGKKLDVGYLAQLPPSKFNLEKWKTVYANTFPTRPEALNYFWTNFDPEGFSIWLYRYNFPEECKKDFMTSNLFGGFLQRLDAVKQLAKFSLTSMAILKLGDNYHITGVWLFRGTVIPPEFKDIDDTNYYTWTKADINSEADRSLVSDIFAWESVNAWGGKGEFVSGRTWGC